MTSKPTLFTVHGTGVTMWDGPPADTARAVEHAYYWQPIGNYPAAPFPMWPSIQQGVTELRTQILAHPGKFALAGYSQGAVVTSLVFQFDLQAPNGMLHNRLQDLTKAVTWGNPMRQRGLAYPDGVAPLPNPNSSGILDGRLVETPTLWRDYAHAGDLYADNPEGDSGEYTTAICKIIMGNEWWTGTDSILAQIIELGQRTFWEAMAAMDAVIRAGMFFASGTGPHVNYNVRPAIDYLRAGM